MSKEKKKKKKSNNRKSGKDFFSISAFCISLISLLISFCQFSYNVKKDNNYEKEDIYIVNKSVSYKEEGKYRSFTDNSGLIDGVIYEIVVINNSKQKVSLLSYDFYLNNETHMKYSNMITDISVDDKEISFPLILDIGETSTISLNVNTIIPAKTNTFLKEKFEYESFINFNELSKFLEDRGFDIYGNEVTVHNSEAKTKRVQILNPHFPEYIFHVNSSKGNVFSQIITQ